MYYDQNEHERERHDQGAQLRRVRRDFAGLLLMILGAVATVAAVMAWQELVGVGLLGVYMMVGGWFVASDSSK
ncbi:hypothetical protein [Nonomuraea sp. JJY05]|uniref:hypothetical protein n=1 Tax=Nonomuraea sp. JJY05 TaxID=3350255 RepID=UPI00373F904F